MIFKYVPGAGNASAKLVIIGEAPDAYEEEVGMPFVGPSGQIVNSMLSDAGINRAECYVTNVVKIRPPENKINRLKEYGKTIEDFIPQLLDEIKAIRPNCILALGNTPLKALTGKSGIINYRGSILFSQITGVKIVPSIHPAFLLHMEGNDEGVFKYSTKAYMQLDFKRAVEESKFKEYRLPVRNIQIIKDSLALYNFFKQYENHRRFALDIETIKSIPVCIGISPSPNKAVSIQLINIPETGYIIPYHELAEMHNQLREFLESDREWIGQNWKFDQQKIENHLGIHMKDPYGDTMLLASVVNPEFPKSLQFLASVYSREPFYKDEGREFILGKDPIDQLFIYNGKDACVTSEVFESQYRDLQEYGLVQFFHSYIMRLHKFYMDLESEGMLIDESLWNELYTKYKTRWDEAQKKLQSIAGYDVNAMSPKQVFQFLTRDLNLPIRAGTGEEQLIALLGNHAKEERQKDAISLILDIRRIRKTIGTYISAFPDFDGRMRTSYRISGTETGRSSTSNLDPPLRPTKGFGLAFQTLTKHGNIGADVRRMFIADEGYTFLECDASQAEARVVALLSDDDETLKLFDTTDIHTLTSTWIFGVAYENISGDMRFMGKTVRHAGNYGMGKRRFMLETNASARRFGINVTISEKRAGEILTIFHRKSPRIRQIFHTSVEGILKTQNRTIINPFGRRRQFFERWGDKLFKEAYAFIPQSTIRDHVMMAGLRVKDRIPSLRFVVEAHDSFTCLVENEKINEMAQIFKEEFEREIDFSRCSIPRGKLVIPCEMKIGKNYKDLEKLCLSKS